VLLSGVGAALTAAQETADGLAEAMAGPKASARMLKFLPLLGLVLGTLMGADPLTVLFSGGVGSIALVVGLGLMTAGQLWTAALIRAASRPASTAPLAAAVLAAALRAGLVLPSALIEVGAAWGGRLGDSLGSVGRALVAGQSWEAAWGAAPTSAPVRGAAGRPTVRVLDDPSARLFEALKRALAPVWQSGAEAGPLLEGVSQRFARSERRRLGQAAARLGVYLMAPLGLCYLPAFIALGLVPVILSFADGLLPNL
jgi:tight adherence protein B